LDKDFFYGEALDKIRESVKLDVLLGKASLRVGSLRDSLIFNPKGSRRPGQALFSLALAPKVTKGLLKKTFSLRRNKRRNKYVNKLRRNRKYNLWYFNKLTFLGQADRRRKERWFLRLSYLYPSKGRFIVRRLRRRSFGVLRKRKSLNTVFFRKAPYYLGKEEGKSQISYSFPKSRRFDPFWFRLKGSNTSFKRSSPNLNAFIFFTRQPFFRGTFGNLRLLSVKRRSSFFLQRYLVNPRFSNVPRRFVIRPLVKRKYQQYVFKPLASVQLNVPRKKLSKRKKKKKKNGLVHSFITLKKGHLLARRFLWQKRLKVPFSLKFKKFVSLSRYSRVSRYRTGYGKGKRLKRENTWRYLRPWRFLRARGRNKKDGFYLASNFASYLSPINAAEQFGEWAFSKRTLFLRKRKKQNIKYRAGRKPRLLKRGLFVKLRRYTPPVLYRRNFVVPRNKIDSRSVTSMPFYFKKYGAWVSRKRRFFIPLVAKRVRLSITGRKARTFWANPYFYYALHWPKMLRRRVKRERRAHFREYTRMWRRRHPRKVRRKAFFSWPRSRKRRRRHRHFHYRIRRVSSETKARSITEAKKTWF